MRFIALSTMKFEMKIFGGKILRPFILTFENNKFFQQLSAPLMDFCYIV